MAEKKAPALPMFVNANRADLILPGGTVLPAGEAITLSDELAGNLGVQMWIADGLLAHAPADEPAAEQ